MIITVDRFEGDFAICEHEDGTFKDIPLNELPAETTEGSVLVFADGEYRIDLEAQQERRAKILALQNSIFDE